jgi:hypothetical protein
MASATSNIFTIKYESYSFNDPDLSVVWSITPNISTLFNPSEFGTVLTLGHGALLYNTSYVLSATATNMLYPHATYSTSVGFTTGLPPPQNGSVTISVTSSTTQQTNFTFSISNWTCSGCLFYNVKFNLLGQVTYSSVLLPLTTRPVRQRSVLAMPLPYVTTVTFLIFSDFTNETTTVSA